MERYTAPIEKIIVDEEGDFVLNEEQQIIWDDITKEIDDYLELLKTGLITEEVFEDKKRKILEFGKELEKEGLNPQDYILWHRLIGSGFHNEEKHFDTPKGEIGTFIKELYTKA